jgi:hypothetical protein
MVKLVSALFAGCLAAIVGGSARADQPVELKALVDKALKAMGGADKVSKLKTSSWKGKGTLLIDGTSVPYTEESATQQPDQFRFEMELDFNGQKLNQILVIDGDKGWIKVANQTTDMPKNVRSALKDYFYALGLAMNPAGFLDKEVKLAPLGEIKVGDKTAVGIQAVRMGRRDVNLYFDKDTGLPLKIDLTAGRLEDEMEVSFEFLFNEYKDFDGAKVCTQMTWKRDGKVYLEREVSEIKTQEKLGDGVFNKP